MQVVGPRAVHPGAPPLDPSRWLDALAGGIDTSHASILNRALKASSTRPGIDPRSPMVRGGPPTLELDLPEYGYQYAGARQLPEGGNSVRASHHHAVHAAAPGSAPPGGAAGYTTRLCARPLLGADGRSRVHDVELHVSPRP